LVFILARNPWVRTRLILLGCQVLFMVFLPASAQGIQRRRMLKQGWMFCQSCG
jgi:hypothetical protein